jgi:Kef-type K+ transport system membrane component KefB
MAVRFLSAALSELIGLEGIFGAFLSGLILNRYIPHISPLMNRIEFIGNALFIPYFLIGVGMLINLRTIFDGPNVLGIVLLIAFFGTFGKALAAYLSSLLFRLPKAEGHMMFGLTSAHAAGAIAMVTVGMHLEVSPGVIEAALAMGATTGQIIRRFLLPEALSSIVLAMTTGTVGLLGATAMAGYVGGGGVGDLALTYGYQRYNFPLLILTIVILVLFVQLLQMLGNRISGRLRRHR